MSFRGTKRALLGFQLTQENDCFLVLLRFSGHLKMSAIMRTEVFHDEEEKLSTIQPRVQA